MTQDNRVEGTGSLLCSKLHFYPTMAAHMKGMMGANWMNGKADSKQAKTVNSQEKCKKYTRKSGFSTHPAQKDNK